MFSADRVKFAARLARRPHTHSVTRRIRETFHGQDLPEVRVEVDGIEYTGGMRAKAVNPDPASNEGDDWWVLVQWPRGHGGNLLDWFPGGRVQLVADLVEEDARKTTRVVPLPRRAG
jgi:hypothetical protein